MSDTRSRRAAVACESWRSVATSSSPSALLLRLDLLLVPRELRLGAFQLRRDRVRVHHALEHSLFGGAQVALRGHDLVLHRLIFAIRLHLGQLVLEFRETPLVDSRGLLDFAPRLLVLLEALLHDLDRVLELQRAWRRRSPSRCGCEAIRAWASAIADSTCWSAIRRSRSGDMGGLEVNAGCQTPMPKNRSYPPTHQLRAFGIAAFGIGLLSMLSGPARIRTWDQPIMSRPL